LGRWPEPDNDTRGYREARTEKNTMPWLLVYLLDDDVTELCSMLDADPDIALIRPDGSGRWKAVRHIPALPDGRYALWHMSDSRPNKPDAVNPAKALWFAVGDHWPRVTDLERSALSQNCHAFT
jgi:hypothetical protein